jgi:hypothetical protein
VSDCPPAWDKPAPTGRSSWIFFENLLTKFKFNESMTEITDTLYEDLRTFTIAFRLILLEWEIISDKSCRENQNRHFMCVCVCVCEIFEDSNATLIFGWVYYSENHRLRSCRQKAPLFRRADARVYPCLSIGQNISLHYITLHRTNIMQPYITAQNWTSSWAC